MKICKEARLFLFLSPFPAVKLVNSIFYRNFPGFMGGFDRLSGICYSILKSRPQRAELCGSCGMVKHLKQIGNQAFWQNATGRDLFSVVNRFAVPLILTGILQLVYNAADSAVVGRWAGSSCLAAVGSTTHVVFLLITLFNGISIGANYLAARCFGADDSRGLSETVHCAVFLALVLGLGAGVLGFFLSTPLLRLVDTPEDVLPLSSLYMRIYFLGVPALVTYNFGAALLRAVKDTRFPLIVMIFTGLLNVGLNLLLVIVFHLDVAGVAIATTISQTVSAVAVLLRLSASKEAWHLAWRQIRLIPERAGEMVRVGLSAGIQGAVFSIANVLIQSRVNSFQAAAMAGNTAANSLENFIHTAQNAYYQAAITFTSQAMGAGEKKQVFPIFRVCLGTAAALGLVLCTLLRIFQIPLLGIYIRKTDAAYAAVMAAGCIRVAYISQFQWVGGLMETACGSLRGLGMTANPTVTTLLGSCALRVIWIYTVFAFFGTLQSLYISYPISWVLTFGVHLLTLLHWRRKAFGGAAHV